MGAIAFTLLRVAIEQHPILFYRHGSSFVSHDIWSPKYPFSVFFLPSPIPLSVFVTPLLIFSLFSSSSFLRTELYFQRQKAKATSAPKMTIIDPIAETHSNDSGLGPGHEGHQRIMESDPGAIGSESRILRIAVSELNDERE